MGHSRSAKRLALTAEQAAQRIEELRRVYDEGFLDRDEFETMKRHIEARVKPIRPSRMRTRPRGAVRARRSPSEDQSTK